MWAHLHPAARHPSIIEGTPSFGAAAPTKWYLGKDVLDLLAFSKGDQALLPGPLASVWSRGWDLKKKFIIIMLNVTKEKYLRHRFGGGFRLEEISNQTFSFPGWNFHMMHRSGVRLARTLKDIIVNNQEKNV